jgi:TRAP-type mannitol/chloroaromatic compound transport system permease small subunit
MEIARLSAARFLVLPETPYSKKVDGWILKIGQWISWLWLVLLSVIVLNVLLRYAFDEGRIEFEEIQWHLYAAGFLLGLSYAYQSDAHIRVDVLHERFSARTQAWLELYGIILLLLPFIWVVLYHSIPFTLISLEQGEVSQAPGGLPMRWIIKGMLPLGFGLLLLATLSRLSRAWTCLFGNPGTEARHGG